MELKRVLASTAIETPPKKGNQARLVVNTLGRLILSHFAALHGSYP